MSNFKYLIKDKKCYLIFGDYRMKILWKERWIPTKAEVTIIPTITLNKSSVTFTNFEGTETLVATALPEGYSGSLVWSSSNENIATVSQSGVVTPVKYTEIPDDPTCVITCKSSLDASAKATCTVTSNIVLPTAISLNEDSLSFTTLDETAQLTPTFTPANAITDVVWSSNNAHVTVSDSGLVTAKSSGNSTITCKSAYKNSIKATCSVTTTIE